MAHVLIVEDHPSHMKVLMCMLEESGHEYHAVRTAEAALGLVESHEYDAIIIDVGLPGMDGISATEIIRSDPRHAQIPVIGISHWLTETERLRMLASGISEVVHTPIDEDLCIDVLRRFSLSMSPMDQVG